MTARRLRLGLMGLVALATGCDFTPALDIPLPEHEPGLVVQSVLMADSTVSVFVASSADPFDRAAPSAPSSYRLLTDAAVDLLEGGRVIERLAIQPGDCAPYSDTPEIEDECGVFASLTTAEVGRTYTIRASFEGYAEASGTVTIPDRVQVEGTVERTGLDVSFTLRDPAGLGESYAMQFRPREYRRERTYEVRNDDGTPTGRDTTVVIREVRTPSFRTRDPFLVAAARVIPDEFIRLAAFDDKGFDGTTQTLSVSAFDGTTDPELSPDPGALWLISLDATLYKAYETTSTSLGEDNPFRDPSNLPSNVEGGYGLVGAATVAEFELPEPSPAQRAGA